MSSFALRPHFEQVLDWQVEEAQARLLRGIQVGEYCCEPQSFPGFVCLRIPEHERHFWSPRLNLSFEPVDGQYTQVKGVYGPNANVWSLFLYGYLIIGTLAFFAGSLAIVQLIIGHSPWAFWFLGAMLLAAAGLYVLAQFGQKLGATQQFRLHQIYEGAVGGLVDIH